MCGLIYEGEEGKRMENLWEEMSEGVRQSECLCRYFSFTFILHNRNVYSHHHPFLPFFFSGFLAGGAGGSRL